MYFVNAGSSSDCVSSGLRIPGEHNGMQAKCFQFPDSRYSIGFDRIRDNHISGKHTIYCKEYLGTIRISCQFRHDNVILIHQFMVSA